MAATPAQIAANRQNALRSTGPKTVEGKEAARRNALKHGMTGGGVVVPGEDEAEVAIRCAKLEARLAVDGDPLEEMLVRQIAIATIRVDRAFRHESALAAERMRRAGDDYDDERQMMAARILDQIATDPVTARRRLLAAPEGIDVLLKQLRALRAKAEPATYVAWDEAEGAALGHCLGFKPGQAPASKIELLTRAIIYDHWVGLDPAEFADRTAEDRLLWAVGEIRGIIDAEIAVLEAHRTTLDAARPAKGRAEAAQRSLVDLGGDGTALRRYAGAAERTILKMLGEIRLLRAAAAAADDAAGRAATAAAAVTPPPPPPAERPQSPTTEILIETRVAAESASFCAAPPPRPRPDRRAVSGSLLGTPLGSYVPITAGRPPRKAAPPRS